MKKRNLVILTMIAAVMTIISCEKDVTTSAVKVDTSKTATLKVYIDADLDTAAGLEKVPDGTSFIVSVMNADLNPAYTGAGQWSETVTSTNGVITLPVPTIEAGVTVTIDAIAFEATYNDGITIDQRVYELATTVIDVLVNSNRVETRTMSSRTISSEVIVVP